MMISTYSLWTEVAKNDESQKKNPPVTFDPTVTQSTWCLLIPLGFPSLELTPTQPRRHEDRRCSMARKKGCVFQPAALEEERKISIEEKKVYEGSLVLDSLAPLRFRVSGTWQVVAVRRSSSTSPPSYHKELRLCYRLDPQTTVTVWFYSDALRIAAVVQANGGPTPYTSDVYIILSTPWTSWGIYHLTLEEEKENELWGSELLVWPRSVLWNVW